MSIVKRALVAPLTALGVFSVGLTTALASGVLDHGKPPAAHCSSWVQPISTVNTYPVPVYIWDRDGALPREILQPGQKVAFNDPALGTEAVHVDTLFDMAVNDPTHHVGQADFKIHRPADC